MLAVHFKFLALLAFLIVLVSTNGFLSPSLCFRRRPSSSIVLSMSSASTVTVRAVNTASNSRELARCASLLAQSMYSVELPRGQASELTRLELKDLEARYGATVGKRKYPSQFFVAEEDQEFLGAVGLDCQYLDNTTKKFTMFRPSRTKSVNEYAEWEDKGDKGEIVVVLANLAVRRDRRKKGIAQQLMQAAEQFVRDEITPATGLIPAIHLLVDSENIPAQKLYKKLGYKLQFEDDTATCVVSGEYNLQTQDCINYCFKKNLANGSSGGKGIGLGLGGGGVGGGMGGLFNSLFGGKK